MEIERVELDKGVIKIKSNHKFKTRSEWGIIYSIFNVLSKFKLSDKFYKN